MNLTPYHAKYFAFELTKRVASDSIEKLASALVDAKVDLNPHQVEAALFAFRSPLSKGAILADEVGLGKTIEAGLVLSQKWAERKRKDWNFSVLPGGRQLNKDIIKPTSLIPKLVFTGFEKAGHLEYKFDSGTEKDFAYILENDKEVLKWLRPAQNQFRIYWANNSKQYYPDFVVETGGTIYMIETKAADQMESADVLDKKKAAETYCKYASEFTEGHGGKAWKYVLIGHDEVNVTRSFGYFK